MRKNLCFCLVALFLFIACGGGGGGGVATVAGTTPLDENDPLSLSGTYQITRWEFYGPDGFYFDSTQLASFSSTYIVNQAQKYVEFKIEWHDSTYGDYYDYDRVYSDEPLAAEYGEVYYQINTSYQVTIYMTEIIIPGVGSFDQIVRMTKISDSTAPIQLKRSVGKVLDSPTLPIKPELLVFAF